MLISNTPLTYNKIIYMTKNNNLKLAENNSNRNIIKKNNYNKKINKTNNKIYKANVNLEKNSSISNVTFIKNNIMKEKNNY